MSIEIEEVVEDNGIYTFIKKSPIEINFDEIWQMRPTVPQQCKIFGKTIDVPRHYAVYGVSYAFAGQPNISNDVLPPCLEPFLQYGNSILVNWYADGTKYIGYHSDDQKGLVGEVFGFSYGAERKFKFQNKKTKEIHDLVLHHNSLIIMKEHTQKNYKHSLPAMKKVQEPRISITFRTLQL
tara:strand:- start:185 stop:727 length:543 start_codon:yes stop_codon:yes gene_type:complete